MRVDPKTVVAQQTAGRIFPILAATSITSYLIKTICTTEQCATVYVAHHRQNVQIRYAMINQ